MTGHGRGTAEVGGRRATAEIRSVNHRYFDVKLRSSWMEPGLEERVSQILRKRVERGSFTVTVRDEGLASAAPVRVDLPFARSVHAALVELRTALGMTDPVSLALVVAQPGVLQVGEPSGGVDTLLASVTPAVELALEELIVMRRREGATLAEDLRARLGRIATLAEEIGAIAAASPEEWRRRLDERLHKLLAGANVSLDETRLATEVAVLADRLDVTEELVRLRSHLAQGRALLAEDAPVGRKLDFLTQEFGREINTIGSKSQSADITKRVVEAKAELEKVREQVQNVE